MFEFIRTHRRLMQFLLLLFIVPSFALFGLESYTRFNEGDNAVAKVGGQTITQQELDAAHREQMERLRQMFGPQFDPKMFDTAEARQGTLESLIARRAMAVEAAKNNLSVPDTLLQQAILREFGAESSDQFDNERYKSLLSMNGMTPAMYEARLRQQLALQQLASGVQSSAFAPKTVATRVSELNDQQREVQELLFKASDFTGQVKVTDDMLKDYYEKNAAQFQLPEQAKIEYLLLDQAHAAAKTSVSDEEIKSYYEQNVKRYTVEEQRRARHILIGVKKDASAAEKAAAKAKAEELVAQLRNNPEAFAKLAKEHSQDPGSAENGGDLGFFGRGAMVKPFEDAAYKLKEGEISDVVESDFGFHIIQVTGVKPGQVQPLAEVKDEIAAEIRKQKAAKKYSEMAETFSDIVYEQSDSLKPAADKLGLEIQTAANISREPNPKLPAALNNPKFLEALFSDETIKNKRNTDAVEVAPNTMVAARVLEYRPATRRPFEEVKDVIRERVVQAEALQLAQKAGQAKLAELKEKSGAEGFGPSKTVSRSKSEGIASGATAAIMKADATKLPAYVGVELPGQGYGVYRISKVTQPESTDAARRQDEQQQIGGLLAQQEMHAYIEALKKEAEVKVLKPVAAPAETAQ